MATTLIGVYDSYTQAQEAMQDLAGNGFGYDTMQLSPEQDTSAARAEALPDAATASAGEQGLGASIRHFFHHMFGSENTFEHAGMYAEAVRRGHCLLTVQARDDQQSRRALEIMNRHQPTDIEERASQWKSRGWSGYEAGAQPWSESEIEQERQTGMGELERGGVRAYQHMQEEPVVSRQAQVVEEVVIGKDDDEYRRHWQSTYGPSGGQYADYAQAYRYGSSLANDARYRGYRWSEAEMGLRQDWESSHTESPWERVKDAVRYGWEKMTR